MVANTRRILPVVASIREHVDIAAWIMTPQVRLSEVKMLLVVVALLLPPYSPPEPLIDNVLVIHTSTEWGINGFHVEDHTYFWDWYNDPEKLGFHIVAVRRGVIPVLLTKEGYECRWRENGRLRIVKASIYWKTVTHDVQEPDGSIIENDPRTWDNLKSEDWKGLME